jgi:DNA-binding NarL/FixJ family response regulator
VAAKRGTAAPVISVLVVDDHRTFAEALGVVFGLEKDLRAEVAASAAEAVEAADRAHPDVILMDLEMPGGGGLDAIRKVHAVHPAARVVAVSAHDEELVRAQAIEAGAVGFISKATPLGDLPEIVRKVGRGEAMLDRQEAARLLRVLRRRRHQESTERQRANRLTPRQTQIMQMMADGASSEEIARRLKVSPYTLRTHVQNILTRLGVHTKVEAMAIAIRHGKISARS